MKSPEELIETARGFEREGNDQRALETWRRVAELDPSCPVLCSLGWAAETCGDIEEAIEAFERAAKVADGSPRPLIALGILAIDGGRFADAERFLTPVAEQANAHALSLLGLAQWSMGKDREAEESLTNSIALDPSQEEAHCNLGLVLRRSRPAEAEERFRQALDLDSAYAAAHRELGYLLSQKGEDSDTAERHLRKAIEIEPGQPWAHIYLGAHLEKNGDQSAAMNEYRLAADLAPDLGFPFWCMGTINESNGDSDLALTQLKKAVELEPDDPSFNRSLGRLYVKLGRIELAEQFLARGRREDDTGGVTL